MASFPLDDDGRKLLKQIAPAVSAWAEARDDWKRLLPPPPNGAAHLSDVLRNVVAITGGITGDLALETREWDILALAVLLHDIGRTQECERVVGSEAEGTHHAHRSWDYIRRGEIDLPVSDEDRISVAIVCRAHGYSRHDMGQYYGQYNGNGRPRLPLLGAILRLADEVDNSVARYGPLIGRLPNVRRDILSPKFDPKLGAVVYYHQAAPGTSGVPLEVGFGFYHVWASTVRVLDDTHDELKRAGVVFSVARFHPPFDLTAFCHNVMDTGLIGYLPTRELLEQHLPIERIVQMARDGGVILVIARTAVRWARALESVKTEIMSKRLRLRLAVATVENLRQIGGWVSTDRETSLHEFRRMMEEYEHLDVRVIPETVQQAITIVETWTGLELATLDTPLVTVDERGSFVLDLSGPTLRPLSHRYRKLWDLGMPLHEYDRWVERLRGSIDDQRLHDELFPSIGGGEIWTVLPRLLDCERRPVPLCVQVEVTNRCNSHCKACGRWETPEDRPGEDLDPGTWRSLLEGLAAGPRDAESYVPPAVVLSGGEPLLWDDLPERAQEAVDLGLHLGMYTNGICLSADLAERCSARFDWIRVSLDALAPDTYPEVRGRAPEVWHQVMDGCRFLSHAATSDRARLSKVGVSYLIQSGNIQELLAMLDGSGKAYDNLRDLAEWGVPVYFKFATQVPAPKRPDTRDDFLVGSVLLQELLDRAGNSLDDRPLIATATNLRYLLSKFRPGEGGDPRYSVPDVTSGQPLRSWLKARAGRCHVPRFAAVVDYLGRCFPCCYEADDNAGVNREWHHERARRNLGTVGARRESFWEVWTSEQWREWQPSAKVCGWCTRFGERNALLDSWDGKDDFRRLAQPYASPVWL